MRSTAVPPHRSISTYSVAQYYYIPATNFAPPINRPKQTVQYINMLPGLLLEGERSFRRLHHHDHDTVGTNTFSITSREEEEAQGEEMDLEAAIAAAGENSFWG